MPFSFLLLEVLANEGLKIGLLAQGNALLAHDVVSSGEVEEDVGQNIAVEVVGAGHLESASRAHSQGDELVLALVDDVLVGSGEDLFGLGDAGVAVGKGLNLALPGMRLDAGQTGDELG